MKQVKVKKVNWSTLHEHGMGQSKKLSPRQESNPWPPEQRAGALSIELQQLVDNKVI